MEKVAFLITTYNRSESCKRLVDEIKGLGDVYIIDDCSSQDYSWAKEYNYVRNATNGGKKYFWRTITTLWQMVRPKVNRYKYFFMLQDDFILVNGFLDKAIKTWESIQDSNKVCLGLYVGKSRHMKECWTKFRPRVYPEAIKTQWTDMWFMCERKLFDALKWRITYIAPRPAKMSSGVGVYISKNLHKRSLTIWHPHTTLLLPAPEALESKMHTYRNGTKASAALHTCVYGDVIAKIASIPSRADMLEKTIASLRPQVDKIFVGLNNYTYTPTFLKEGEYIHLDNSTGDAAKFYDIENINGYVLTCDDDLVYPEDYAQYMINGLHRHRAVTTMHGKKYTRPYKGMFKRDEHIRYEKECTRDTVIDVAGTGVMCFHTDMIKVKYSDFRTKNMADIWFAKLAKEQKVKIVALSHKEGYVVSQNPINSIFEEAQKRRFSKEKALLRQVFA